MKKIGMLVAITREMRAVFARYGKAVAEETRCGVKLLTYDMGAYQLIIAGSGAGEIAAAAACALLIDRYEVELVVNFGVVGGLTEEMTRTKTCVIERVVHYDFDTSACDGTLPGQYCEYPDVYLPATPALVRRAMEIAPELKPVTCASGDKFVEGGECKSALREQFGADICEMEAAAVVLTCNRSGVPCLLIKTVADALFDAAEDFNTAVQHSAENCLDVADKIIREL